MADELSLCLLGPMVLRRGAQAMALPASRKARALLAYLALSPRPVSRDALCRLLWDAPVDARAELRWCLSRLRGVLDLPSQPCVIATDTGGVQLALQPAQVDVLRIDATLAGQGASAPALRGLLPLFAGDLLEGLEIDRSPAYAAWLLGQRRRLRAVHAQVLQVLADALPTGAEERIELLGRWLQLAPLALPAHQRLLQALAQQGRWREAQEQLESAMRRFVAEGVDATALSHAWRGLRQGQSAMSKTMPTALPAAPRQQPAPPADELPTAPGRPARLASIAVMPFVDMDAGTADTAGAARTHLGAWLAHDVTTRLARLRSLFVISQGSATALAERGLDAEQAAQALGVAYVASGYIRRDAARVRIDVQLAEAPGARVVWADVLSAPVGDLLTVLEQLGDQLVGALASQVELAERRRAVLKPPGQLDAWEAHHCGLWFMYRFNAADNQRAQQFFQAALRLDPNFSRAHAGLSFTHFQNAFLGWGPREQEAEQAWRAAQQGVLADEQDPATRWALGRAHWLRGQLPQALDELQASVDLSPNFSQGHYSRAFVLAQSGDALDAIAASDHARELSPFDPLLFAMLATRSVALMRLGRHQEAADWALKAIARPNAHVHILAIAVHCLVLAERLPEARSVMATIAQRAPGYRLADFLAAFRLDEDGTALVRRAAPAVGLA